eukprot:SAG31_NODE_23909_length_493_cov_0.626904_1_plen_48_part_10
MQPISEKPERYGGSDGSTRVLAAVRGSGADWDDFGRKPHTPMVRGSLL